MVFIKKRYHGPYKQQFFYILELSRVTLYPSAELSILQNWLSIDFTSVFEENGGICTELFSQIMKCTKPF